MMDSMPDEIKPEWKLKSEGVIRPDMDYFDFLLNRIRSKRASIIHRHRNMLLENNEDD